MSGPKGRAAVVVSGHQSRCQTAPRGLGRPRRRDADREWWPVLKVRARPVEGEANNALIPELATALGVSRSAVTLARGGRPHLKMIRVEGLGDADLQARLTDP